MTREKRVVANGDERTVVANGSKTNEKRIDGKWVITSTKPVGAEKSGVYYKNHKDRERGR